MYLDAIVRGIKSRLIEHKKEISPATMKQLASAALKQKQPRSLVSALSKPEEFHLILEFKSESPTTGLIQPPEKHLEFARIFEASGAAAISCLTEPKFFGGSYSHLKNIASSVSIPVLDKNFIIDKYQIDKACANHADAILLIAAILDRDQLIDLFNYAHAVGLDVLPEVYSSEDLQKLKDLNPKLIAFNNRDLKDFSVNIDHSIRLADGHFPSAIKIAASGLKSPEDLHRIQMAGFNAALIGESVLRNKSPLEFISELKLNLTAFESSEGTTPLNL